VQIDDLTREFLIESQEGLDRMEHCLTELEVRPGDAALLAEIFRAVHTIKGTTGFLGFKRLEKLAHAGENLLGLLRDGKLDASPRIVTALLQLLDGLRAILKTIETEGTEGDGVDLSLIASIEAMQSPVQQLDGALPPRAIKSAPRKRSARKSAVPKSFPLAPKPVSSPHADPPIAVAPPAPASVRPPEQAAESATLSSPPAPSAASESTLRVDVALLNRLMNLVGELVLTRNQILQATSGDAGMTILSRRLDMVTADLRESVMKARMQPVSNIFSKMPRLVRDLSQALQRQVRLEMEGQDTDLDKSLLEAIKDPLTHAVRNALDHGIEPPAQREAAGKNSEGVLRLRAVQEGSHVLIEVSDDGAGIAVDRVREKAIERGLLSAERAALLGERELLQLIFLPGFSTAPQITRVSGRGVGMDVVRTNVEKIGGKVEIDSRIGKGTTLRMRIPLTLAIIPALIVHSRSRSFALPQGALSELLHVSAEEDTPAIEWIDDAPLYRLRGKLLPLVFLDRLLAPASHPASDTGHEVFIAVLDADGRRYGLVVDGLGDPEEIVVKPLSSALKDIGLYSGATVLGSGELALILDPGAIAQRAGIRMAADDEATLNTGTEKSDVASSEEFLLVEIAGRRAAVPLGDVMRIEQLPARRIEYAASRPVLNFAGQLLPVEDSAGLIEEALSRQEARIIVVVCRDGHRQVGIVVSHVLDVAAGRELFEAGKSEPAESVILLKEQVTGILGLGGVPPLPSDTSSWSSTPAVMQ
jgi:two-component system chemotaxis sensor kinase CheA